MKNKSNSNHAILELQNIYFEYYGKGIPNTILDDVSFSFEKGKVYVLMGESGSGKSTLLSILSGLLKPLKGIVNYLEQDISEKGMRLYRKNVISMIHQSYNLIPYLNAFENIDLVVNQKDKTISKEIIEKALLDVNLDQSKWNRRIAKLSGGEQQRVAVARALAKNSEIILADEPTGNLDKETAKTVLNLLVKCARDFNKCVIIVTHSEIVANEADVLIHMDHTLKNIKVQYDV